MKLLAFALLAPVLLAGPFPTSTVLTVSPAQSTLGQPVTLTATVTSPGSPFGPVAFYDGATMVGSATLAGGKATLTTALLPAGTASLRAVYVGNVMFTGSTSPAVTATVSAVAGLALSAGECIRCPLLGSQPPWATSMARAKLTSWCRAWPVSACS